MPVKMMMANLTPVNISPKYYRGGPTLQLTQVMTDEMQGDYLGQNVWPAVDLTKTTRRLETCGEFRIEYIRA